MNEYLELFTVFAKIGVMTFGGGYAMLPMMQREMSEKRGWATEEEILDYFAIGQCTPGVIAVNTATFIGRKRKGTLGSVFATLGIIFPSLVIITLIAAFLRNFSDYPAVKNAFAGIGACVCVLIINAVAKMWKKAVKDAVTFVVFLTVFLCTMFLDISPAVFVVAAAVVGIAAKRIKGGKAQ